MKNGGYKLNDIQEMDIHFFFELMRDNKETKNVKHTTIENVF